jgi:hypothetical protein
LKILLVNVMIDNRNLQRATPVICLSHKKLLYYAVLIKWFIGSLILHISAINVQPKTNSHIRYTRPITVYVRAQYVVV